MATSSPRTLSLIMQQGLAAPSPGAPEPFPFGHTKPLSHFVSEPGPPKMPSVPAASRQPALLHYLQQPTLTPASSATASSTATASLQLQQQPDAASFLLQHVTQQPQRVQRSVASDSMPSLPRQVSWSPLWLRPLVLEIRTTFHGIESRLWRQIQAVALFESGLHSGKVY